MRVVTYNVHACIGRDGRFMPERIADVLEPLDADFIALQEVEDRPVGTTTVADLLGERLDMHVYRGATMDRTGTAYGNVLLAGGKADSLRLHDISIDEAEPRGVIEANFSVGGARLRLLATHLGLTARERALQIRSLLPLVTAGEADVRVLAGDLNEWRPGAFVTRRLRRVFGRSPRPRSFPSRRPLFALDAIHVLPRRALDSVRVARSPLAVTASDHLPVVGDVKLCARSSWADWSG